MKIIYQVVLAVTVITQIQISWAEDGRRRDGESRRRGGAGRGSVNVVNEEFRRGYNVSSDPAPVITRREPRHQACTAPKFCKTPAPFPGLEDYTDFMFNFSDYSKTLITDQAPQDNDCSCLDNKFKEDLGPRFLMELGNERKELNEKIKKAAAKKFLNDYAANIEDASFFLLKTSGVFTNPDTAKEIQCNDYRKFNDMVTATCGNAVLNNPAMFEEKKLALLNVLGGASRPGMNFDQRIRDISRQIQFLPIPGQTSRDGKPLQFSRSIYDESRIGLSRSPEGQFVEHVIQKMIKNADFESQIRDELTTKTPIEAIMSIIERNIGNTGFLDKIGADKSITGNELGTLKEVREDFKFLMQTHPGFMNVMGKPANFLLLMNSVKRENQLSLLEQLETKPDILGSLLLNRCDDLTKQFADIVCTQDDDLIKSVDASELDILIHPESETTDSPTQPELHDLLMCLESGKDPKAAFGHLADLEREDNFTTRRSDYIERLLVPDIEQHKNLFSVTMLKSVRDRKFRKEMERYAEAGRSYSRAVSSPGIVARDVYVQSVAEGNDFTIGKSTISKSEAKEYMKSVASEETKIASGVTEPTTKTLAAPSLPEEEVTETRKPERMIASEGPMTAYGSSSYRQETEENKPADQRQVLSRDLARSNPEPEVERHVSKLDDETISQLTSLRNMNSSLMSQMIAEEERKLQEYRDRLSSVRTNLPPSEPQLVEAEVTNVAPQVVPSERPSTDTQVKSVPVAARSITSAALQQAPSRGEEATVAQIVPERRGGDSLAASGSSDSGAPSLSLTIISSQRAQVSDQAPEVIENEVKTYLEGKALAPAEFEDLMRNGLRYQYQVVVNDVLVTKEKIIPFTSLPEKTRRDLETKYARDRLEIQTSKLAVLRMLMNSTVVR